MLFAYRAQPTGHHAQEGEGHFRIFLQQFGQVPGRQGQADGGLLCDDVGHARGLIEHGQFTEEVPGTQGGQDFIPADDPNAPAGDEVKAGSYLALANDMAAGGK